MKLSQIIVNSLWYGVIPKLSMLIGMVLLPVITPYLTPFDYGVYGIINSYSGIVMLVAVMGLNIHLTNSYYVYKHRFRLVWSRVLTILLLSGITFALLYGAVISVVLTDITGPVKTLSIVLACIPIALMANTTLAQHYYPLIYKPRPLVLRNLAASLTGMAVMFVCIYYLRLGFIGWLAGTAVASITAFLLFIHPLWVKEKILPTWQISASRLKKWLTVSLPLVPHSLGFILLTSSDRIIMDMLGVAVEDIGLYSNGYQMGDYTITFTSAMIIAVAPRIQELYRSKRLADLKNLYLICQILTGVIVILFSLWMPQIYRVLIHNQALLPAYRIAALICFANIVYPFYSFISTAAFIQEKTKKILWLVFLPGTINIILNLSLIPIYGYQIAVYTTIAAYWSQLLIPYVIPYFRSITKELLGNIRLPLYMLTGFLTLFLLTTLSTDLSILSKSGITLLILGLALLLLSRQRLKNI